MDFKKLRQKVESLVEENKSLRKEIEKKNIEISILNKQNTSLSKNNSGNRLENQIKAKNDEIKNLKFQVLDLDERNKKYFEEIKNLKKNIWEMKSNNSIGVKLVSTSSNNDNSEISKPRFVAIGSDEDRYENVFWVAYNVSSKNESALWLKLYKNKKDVIKTTEVCEPTSRNSKYITSLPEEYHDTVKDKIIADKSFYDACLRTRFDSKTLDEFASKRR